MHLAIVGLPQAGKKTIFRILTGVAPERAQSKAGIRYGIAPVRDPRVDVLSAMFNPRRTRYAEFQIALPPDVEPDAARGAEWIEPLRNADALLFVVRAFDADHVFHVFGDVAPRRDIDAVDSELLLADLDLVEKRLARLTKEKVKEGAERRAREAAALERCRTHLETEQPLRTLALSAEEREALHSLQFLSSKPLIVAINTNDEAVTGDAHAALTAELAGAGASVVRLGAAIEEELAALDDGERGDFMADLGIDEPAAHRLSRAAYDCLGLMSFFTVGDDEVRAWSVGIGARAPQAAGVIHSDLERGFIRAETISYDALVDAGSEKAAKEANLYRLNGKDYEVRDGDILHIRFSV